MGRKKKKKNFLINLKEVLKKLKVRIFIQLFIHDKKEKWTTIHTPYWIPYLEFINAGKAGWWKFSVNLFGIVFCLNYQEENMMKKRKRRKK